MSKILSEHIDTIIGIPISIFATLLTLFLFHYLLSPKIKFSEDIRVFRQKNKPPTWGYSIRVENYGIRPLIDVRIRCRIGVRDIHHKESDVWTFFNLETTFKDAVMFSKGRRTVSIKFFESFSRNSSIIKRLEERNKSCDLRLEDIFLAWSKVYVEFFVMGNDRFTGVLKVYESKKYFIFDINKGKWDKLELSPEENLTAT